MSREETFLTATIRTKPGKASPALSILAELAAASRLESGCRAYNFHQAVDEPGVIMAWEIWENDAALEAHFETAHFQSALAALEEILEDTPQLCRMRRVI